MKQIIKDKRKHIFGVGDTVLYRYHADIDSTRNELYTKPQKVKSEKRVEEVIPSTKPFKIIYQLLEFEGFTGRFEEGNLFLPFDDITKKNVERRHEELEFTPDIPTKKLVSKRPVPKKQLFLFEEHDLNFTCTNLLFRKTPETIGIKPEYKSLISDIRRSFPLKKFRAVELVFADSAIHSNLEFPETKNILISGFSPLENGQFDKILTAILLICTSSTIVPTFMFHGLNGALREDYKERNFDRILTLDHVSKIINKVLSENMFTIK